VFRQQRYGFNHKPFWIYKFRTMRVHDDHQVRQATRGDERVTLIGGLLRRWNIDELPQLLNVLLGDLSLVGPRPIVTDEMALYASDAADQSSIGREVTGYWDIPDLRPGITGYWQINGRSDSSYAERVRLDTAYVRNWSVRLDLEILARTLRVIVSKRGAY
jgi:lipopolysaccharide/colanic/teichoic acid biosynthesis glycosyltransferase